MWVGDPAAAEPTYLAETVIVATGARSLMLGVPGEDRLLGYGVSTCATCDGFFFRNQEVAVVGGGDSALEEALFLTRFASKVTVVHRRDQLRASRIMQDRARANPTIEFRWNAQVTEVLGDGKVSGVGRARHGQPGPRAELAVNGLFVAIGHEPNTAVLAGQLELEGQRLRGATSGGPAPASTGSSPAATSRTTTTARPSPRPARAAWRPSTPSAGSRPAGSEAGPDRHRPGTPGGDGVLLGSCRVGPVPRRRLAA